MDSNPHLFLFHTNWRENLFGTLSTVFTHICLKCQVQKQCVTKCPSELLPLLGSHINVEGIKQRAPSPITERVVIGSFSRIVEVVAADRGEEDAEDTHSG